MIVSYVIKRAKAGSFTCFTYAVRLNERVCIEKLSTLQNIIDLSLGVCILLSFSTRTGSDR